MRNLAAPTPQPKPGTGTESADVAGFDLVRLRQVHRNTPYIILFSVFTAVVTGMVLAGRVPALVLAAWLGGNALAVIGLSRGWRRVQTDAVDALRAWERQLAAGLLAQGLLWFGLFCAENAATFDQRAPVQMMAYATVFTGTVVYCISLPAFLALVLPLAAGQLLWITAGQASTAEAAFIVALYAAVLLAGLLSFRRVNLTSVGASLAQRGLLAEHEALFNNSLVGMAHVRDGRFVRVNPEMARILGLGVEEINGSSIWQLYADEAAWQHSAAGARSAGGPVSYEHQYTRPDQQRLTLRVHVTEIASGVKIGVTSGVTSAAASHTGASSHTQPGDHIYTVMDITAARKAEQQLAAREQAYRHLAETYHVITSAAPALIWATDAAGVYSFAGERGSLDILGVPAAQAVGKRMTDLITLPTREQDQAVFKRMLAGETVQDYVSEIVQPDGRRLFISSSSGPVHDAAGAVTGACGISINITGRQRDAAALKQAQATLTNAIESLSDGFALFDANGNITMCNRRYADLMEPGTPTQQQLIGMNIAERVRSQLRHGQIIPPEYLGDDTAWLAARMQHHRDANGKPEQFQTGDGRWIQTTKRRTPDGGVVGIYADVTALKRTEDAVRVLAQHDALTGLPNRRLLDDRLQQALSRAKRESSMAGLLLLDLDGFKPINDQFGHRAGDEVLRVVALRLKECVRAADTVARQGGDEFVIVLDGLANASDAGAVAAKVIAAIKRPIEPVWLTARNTPDFLISASIGISVYPQDGTGAEPLMRCADSAMYRAKKAGRGRFAYHAAPDGLVIDMTGEMPAQTRSST